MSRFANPTATKRFVLGPCDCPGTPHDEDWMDLRSELGAQDLVTLQGAVPTDRMKVFVVAWNLLGDDGELAPIDGEHLGRLYGDIIERLDAWTLENVRWGALPNASGAPSRNGTKASASQTRTTPRRR